MDFGFRVKPFNQLLVKIIGELTNVDFCNFLKCRETIILDEKKSRKRDNNTISFSSNFFLIRSDFAQ